jgi:hypothetical protein
LVAPDQDGLFAATFRDCVSMLLQGDARFEPALDSGLNCGATRKETAGSHVRDIPQLRGAATLPQNQCELRKLCFAMRPS